MSGGPERSQALEAIEKIKAAEERARAIVREAQDKIAAEILSLAAEEAKRIKEQVLARAKAEAEQEKAAILDEARKEAEGISLRARLEIEALKRRADDAMEEAITQIALKIKEILKEGAL